MTVGCYQESPAPAPHETGQTLITLLGDPDESLRRTAAEALGKIGDHRAASFLIHSLRDADPAVREAAARSLGQLTPIHTDAATTLVKLIQDPDETVRRAAAQALGNAENLPALASRLADLTTDSTRDVRRAAVHALMLMDAREAYAALLKSTSDVDSAVRQSAVATLAELGDGRALPILRDRLIHDSVSGVRAEAAYRLRLIGNESVIAEMEIVAQKDDSPDVQRWARRSVEELRRERDSGSAHRPIQPANSGLSRQSP